MKISKLNKILAKKYPNVIAEETKGCVRLSGWVDHYDSVVECGYLAVDKSRYKGVLNDIVLRGVDMPKMRQPLLTDKTLDNLHIDALVIGGGISGASILRELTRYNLTALLVEKESDLALQASGRNDGEVHPGVDLSVGTKKQYYVVRANKIYDSVCKDLGVPFYRCGQYVGFTQGYLKPLVYFYAKKKTKIGAPTQLISKEKLREVEPTLNKDFKFALFNPTAGVVCPYNLTIAYAENAVTNGAKVSLNTAVTSMNVENGNIISVQTNRGVIYPKVVINAAGTFAEDIAKMAQDRYFSIHPRKGTNSILDKKANYLIQTIASIKKINVKKTGHTKGGGIIRTIDKNVLVGPNAIETYEKENFSTEASSINEVFNKQSNTNPNLNKGAIITYFSGTRASTYEEDFYIEKGIDTHNVVHCAGIQSPGLTTAPLVAIDVAKMAVEILNEKMEVTENVNFNPIRKPIPKLNELSDEERTKLIKQNPDYGIIVCRCEQISKGEILDALKSNICVPTLDGIKKRLRPGMGRCQGGFCSPLVAQIIAEYLDVPIEQVVRTNSQSVITYGSTKVAREKDE